MRFEGERSQIGKIDRKITVYDFNKVLMIEREDRLRLIGNTTLIEVASLLTLIEEVCLLTLIEEVGFITLIEEVGFDFG